MRKILIVAAALVFALWYFRNRPSAPVVTSSEAAPAPAAGPGCVQEVENANRLLADSARLLVTMPVDASAWNDAESRTTQAIARAESACTGGVTEADQSAIADAREALSLIRTSLSEAGGAAKGAGGFQGALRQEQIDGRLSSAKAKLGLR